MKNIIVLASGNGTTLDNLMYHVRYGNLKGVVQISKVILDRKCDAENTELTQEPSCDTQPQ